MVRVGVILFIFLFGINCFVRSQSIGGVTTGSALYCDSINSGFISLSGQVGNIITWQLSENNGQSWVNISNTTAMQSFNNLKKITSYRAIVKNGVFDADTSTISTVTVYAHGKTGTLIGGGIYCNVTDNGLIQLNGFGGSILNWQWSITAGVTWTNIAVSSNTLTYNNMTQNTLFRAIVNSYSSCPNDTTSIATFSINSTTITGSVLRSDTVCYGLNMDTLKLIGNNGSVIDWFKSFDNGLTWVSIGTSDSSITYENLKQITSYKAIIKNGVCLSQTTTPVTISIYDITPAEAGANKTLTQYESVILNGDGNGVPTWSPSENLSDPNNFNPSASPIKSTTYTLTLANAFNCLSYDTVMVSVIIPIPNAITPNGDGVNDTFIIDKIKEYEKSKLTVFSRWGLKVYDASPYKNEWDGKSTNGVVLPDDIYYYELEYGNGETPLTGFILINR